MAETLQEAVPTIGEEAPKEEVLVMPDEELTLPPDYSPLTSENNIKSLEGDRRSEKTLSAWANATDYDNLQTNKDILEAERRSAAITAASFSDRRLPADFSTIIQEVANAPLPKKTNGEAIADQVLTETTLETKKSLADGLDLTDTANTLHGSIKDNLGISKDESLKGYLTAPSSAAYETASSIARKTGREVDLDMFEEDGYSMQNLLEFIHPLGGEDVAGMDMEIWETTKDLLSGDFNYNEFDTKMESNYGKHWEARWAGFLAEEVAVDAGLLFLSASVVGAPLATVLKSTHLAWRSRMASIGARAVVLGVGGGSIQAIENTVGLGREANLQNEIIGRAGGSAAVDVLGWGIKGGIRALTSSKSASKEIAEELGTKVLSEDTITESIKAANSGPVSVLANLTRARIQANVKEYDSILSDTAGKITNRNFTSDELKETLLSDLSMMIGKDVKELETVEFDLLLPLMRDNIQDVILTNATKAGLDDVINGRELVNDMFAQVSGKAEKKDDSWRLYFGSKGPDFRETDVGVSKSTDNMLADGMKFLRVSEMADVVGRSLPNLQSASRYSDSIGKGYNDWFKSINKGLTNNDQKVVSSMLSKGGADGVVYSLDGPAPNGISGVTPKIQNAYIQTRMLLDSVHTLKDQSLLRETKDIVYMLKGELVEVTAKTQGKSWEYRKFDVDSLGPIGGKKYSSSDKFTDPTTILPYRNGYVPRMYNKFRFSVLTIDKDNFMSREAMFNTRAEVQAHMATRTEIAQMNNKKLIDAGLPPKDTATHVIQVDHNSGTGVSAIVGNTNSVNIMKAIPDKNMASVYKELEAAGLKPDEVAVLFKGRKLDYISPSSRGRTKLGTATTKKGAELRNAYELAKVNKDFKLAKSIGESIKKELIDSAMPTAQAIREYLDISTREAGMGNFRKVAIDHINSKYADVLAPNSKWYDLKFKSNTPLHIQADAARHASWMQKVMYGGTRYEKVLDDAIVSIESRLSASANSGRKSSAMLLKGMDTFIPTSGQFIAAGRFLPAFTKLLTLNMPHIAIQFFQATNTIGVSFVKGPKATMQAFKRVEEVVAIHSRMAMKGSISPELRKTKGYKAYESLVNSGYTVDLNTADIAFNIKTSVNPSLGRTIFDKIRGGSAIVAKYGGMPFRLGEGGNRIMAYTFMREQAIAAVSSTKGTHNFIGNKGQMLTKADIDTPEFNNAVIEKARVLALDMGKTAELEAMSGWGSLLFQFQQVGFKTVSLFNSSAFSGMEKLGAALTTFSVFGAGGIPFAVDLIKTVDNTLYSLMGSGPADIAPASDYLARTVSALAAEAEDITGGAVTEEMLTRLVTKGGINALTGGEVNILARASMGGFWSEALDMQGPEDSFIALSIFIDMIEMEEAILGLGGVPANSISAIKVFSDMTINNMTFQEAYASQYSKYEPTSAIAKFILSNEYSVATLALDSLRASGKVFSSLGGISRVLDSRNREYINPDAAYKYNEPISKTYLTSSLEPTGVEPSFVKDLSYFLGITPGEVVKRNNTKEREGMLKEAIKKFNKSFNEDLKFLSSGAAKFRRTERWIKETKRMKKYVAAYNLDIDLPTYPRKSAATIRSNIDTKLTSGAVK